MQRRDCLSQTKYLSDLLKRANIFNSKPRITHMALSIILSQEGCSQFEDRHLYRSIVGALQYANLTRSDIAFSANKVSQFLHQPTDAHWCTVKRIFCYISVI
jgi:hypothetical protein